MLDPLLDGIKRLFAGLVAFIVGLWVAALWPFRAAHQFVMKRKLWIRIALGIFVFPIIFSYIFFVWHSLWIRNYDINDYKSKTELTAQKLFTVIIAALRSYRDIIVIEDSRAGL